MLLNEAEGEEKIWTNILRRMSAVEDWGRLQQVSRSFNAIVREHCWTQAKDLKLQLSHHVIGIAEVNEQGCLRLTEEKLVLLAKELAKKAANVQAVTVHVLDPLAEYKDIGGEVLQQLASASLEIKELDMSVDGSSAVSLADFIHSISGTLESLKCIVGPHQTGYGIFRFSLLWELEEALRSCLALKTVDFDVSFGRDMVDSILSGKTQLQEVRFAWFGRPFPASSWLNTGAHLSSCHFGGRSHPVFDAYTRAVQKQDLTADHPLRTLKTLTFDEYPGDGRSPPFDLFPDLEQLDILKSCFSFQKLWTVVVQFVGHYKDAPGNPRALNIRQNTMYQLPCCGIHEKMVFPMVSMQRTGPRTLEQLFVQGNATAKVLMNEFHHH